MFKHMREKHELQISVKDRSLADKLNASEASMRIGCAGGQVSEMMHCPFLAVSTLIKGLFEGKIPKYLLSFCHFLFSRLSFFP